MIAALFIALGIALGIFSGLLPGMHSNTVASVISGLGIEPQYAALAIAAVVGAHLVFQFFPSIFLSIPDDTVVASVLPGHRMALEGRGREALLVCASSVMAAAAASALLLPLSMALFPAIYAMIEPHIWIALSCAALFLLASEGEASKSLLAFFVFLLSGALGIATLRSGIEDPLFPTFSGLFAASGILLSFSSGKRLPKQPERRARLDYLPYIGMGVGFGMLSDLLPGIAAPAQIAVFASVLIDTREPRKFLALVASIAASHAIFAFGTLLSIGKAREGSLAILDEISPLKQADLPIYIGVVLLSAGFSALLLLLLSRRAGALAFLNARALGLGALCYLAAAVAIISGASGLLLFATSASLGLLPPVLGIRRTHVMGVIIVPSILLAL